MKIKIAIYKDESGHYRPEIASRVEDDGLSGSYLRITEIVEVDFAERKEIVAMEIAAKQKEIGDLTLEIAVLRSGVLEEFWVDE